MTDKAKRIQERNEIRLVENSDENYDEKHRDSNKRKGNDSWVAVSHILHETHSHQHLTNNNNN
jgi:hypothetical protein